ncbi:MAG TPA: CD225/dispanin family protein [Candidatus Sumerlaeota bacterium]|jgi:hypothetical protein|nr:MAG: Interferon-induced transmembrane protein [candidate division BRC1 bacterium ADurb.Bin183]HQH12668.1 CD225/dispanin family protein [Candidatus Sumerlaeota bacterium]
MYCIKCGTQNEDNAWKCIQCGNLLQSEQGFQQAPQVYIPNYLAQSILCTLFCCLPFGLMAMFYAVQVNSRIAAGDVQGAMISSLNAKAWSRISFVCGIVFIFLWVFLAMNGWSPSFLR